MTTKLGKLGPYIVHPAADVFPLLEAEELKELAEDIKLNGLKDPVVLNHDGTVLIDGRNRLRACEIANAEITVKKLGAHYTEKQILDYIVSANIRRRQLNPGQKAMVALELEPMYAAAAKERQREAIKERDDRGRAVSSGGSSATTGEQNKSREQAAKVVGASGRAVSQAKAVERDAPDLAEKVKAGQMALDAADRERKRREAAKPKIADPAPKPAPVLLTLRTHDGQAIEYPKPKTAATFNETRGDGISWAGWSWNPVTGCLHGCDYCYARDIATSNRFASAYPAGFTPLFHHERLGAPANTIIPARYRDDDHVACGEGDCDVCAYRRVFVCSMADLYGRWVPDEWIAQVHASMLKSPQWQYILLTKFPARYVGLELPGGAWVGTSVDEQKRVRIAQDAFAKLPGNVIKWLSLEPLREPLQFDDLSMFDWVVIGAQTATRQPDGFIPALAPDFDWVVDIYQKARKAGCKVHFKPNLINGKSPDWVGMRFPDEYPTGR